MQHRPSRGRPVSNDVFFQGRCLICVGPVASRGLARLRWSGRGARRALATRLVAQSAHGPGEARRRAIARVAERTAALRSSPMLSVDDMKAKGEIAVIIERATWAARIKQLKQPGRQKRRFERPPGLRRSCTGRTAGLASLLLGRSQ